MTHNFISFQAFHRNRILYIRRISRRYWWKYILDSSTNGHYFNSWTYRLRLYNHESRSKNNNMGIPVPYRDVFHSSTDDTARHVPARLAEAVVRWNRICVNGGKTTKMTY